MWRAAVVGALLVVSTPAAAQPRGGAGSGADRVRRLLDRAEAAESRGQGARAWRLRARAVDRADEGDGRAALALGRSLPTEPSDAAAPPWPERAAAAAEALQRYLDAADPREHAEARRLHAWATALAGDRVGAIERAAGAAGLQDRAAADTLRRLATLAVRHGELAPARRALEAANRAYPQDNAVLADLGAVELALGEPGSAAERFARILGRQPTNLSVRRDLAGALVASGRADAAVELLARAVERHEDRPELRLELAYAALEAGEPRRAERAARGAIARLPEDDGRGHAALGAALAAQRRSGDAARALREALRRDPDDLRARRGLEALESPAPEPRGASDRLGAP